MALRKPRNHVMLHDEDTVKLFEKYLEIESQLRDLDSAINTHEKKITKGSDLKITITHLLQKKKHIDQKLLIFNNEQNEKKKEKCPTDNFQNRLSILSEDLKKLHEVKSIQKLMLL